MIILGIDPGTATVGFGIIKKQKGQKSKEEIECVEYGCIFTDKKLAAGKRLLEINKGVAKLIKKHQPDIMAVETLYFFKNLKTVMPVSQARGVILLAAAEKNIPVQEFTPLQMKMAITGYGRAEKKQIQKMIQVILRLQEPPKKDDAADALGIALCCAFAMRNPIEKKTDVA